MSHKLLFVEWDDRELRLLTARQTGEVLEAWAVPLADSHRDTLAATLTAEVERHKLQKAETVLAVSRRDVEIRELDVPPGPPEEQPDIVRFLAPKEFTQYDDDAVIDFYEIGRRDQMHRMLVALLDHEKRQRLLDCLHQAHLTPHQLALRPLSASVLLEQDEGAPRLLADIAAEDADLSVHNGHQVVSVRNVRLPEDDGRVAALQAELRRTLALARNQLGKELSEVVMFGAEAEHRELTSQWSLDVPLRLVDPLEKLSLPASVDYGGRFASLVGLARLRQTERAPLIDFLNPRKRPKPKSKLTTAMLLGIGAGVVALAAALLVVLQLRSLDGEIRDLALRRQKAQEAAAKSAEIVEHRDVVQEALDSDVVWLDELRRVSQNALTYDDLTITKWTGRVRDVDPRGGVLALDGAAQDQDAIEQFEDLLRDVGRTVQGKGHDFDERNDKHPFLFRQLTVSIDAPSALQEQMLEVAADGEAPGEAEEAGENAADGTSGADQSASGEEAAE